MKKSVLLIGDTIVDKYEYLKPVGFSLETPTIKTDAVSTRKEFGGAANVAFCLSNLGCEVDFLTSVADDDFDRLKLSTQSSVINVFSRSQCKERYYLLRNECYKYLQINRCEKIPEYEVPKIDFDNYDLCIVSDYRLGVLNKSILELLPKSKTVVQMQISDSAETLQKYHGFHGVVGNSSEVQRSVMESYITSEKFNFCVSTEGPSPVAARNKMEKFDVEVKSLTGLKDYHGAGDAFYAGFCAEYDCSIENLRESIESGIRSATRFLTREQNAN